MTPMQIRPGIVWCLDPAAVIAGDLWYQGLDSGARQLFRVARDKAAVERQLVQFNDLEYNAVLEGLGIQPDPLGMRVNIVLVANGMGPDAFENWSGVFESLQELGGNVQALDPQLVLLAHHEEHGRQDRRIVTHALPHTPWLVSTRSSDKRNISTSEVQQLLGGLLDALLLAERVDAREETTRTFFSSPMSAGMVRLVGQPRMDLAGLISNMVRDCELDLLKRLIGPEFFEKSTRLAFRDRLREQQRMFLRGEWTGQQLLGHILGRGGLGDWEIELLLAEGPQLLGMLVDQRSVLEQAIRGEVEADVTAPASDGVRRLLRSWQWLREVLGVKPPQGSLETGGDASPEDIHFVLNRLRWSRKLLDEISAAAGAITPPVRVPEHIRKSWRADLVGLLRDALRDIAEFRRADEDSAGDVRRRLRLCVEEGIRSCFTQAIKEWGFDTGPVRDLRTGIENGSLLHFTGLVEGGLPLECDAVLTSLDLGERLRIGQGEAPCLRTRFWRQIRPIVVAASRPVPAGSLVW